MSATFEAPSDFVDFIRFGFYSSDEVRELSVKKITRPELFDAKGVPVQNGLYDLSMGAVKDSDSCKTCGLGSYQCPGHCGHIELVETLYNPLLFRSLKSFLQITCFHCKKFRMNEPKVRRYISILKYIIDGDIIAARSIETTALSEVVLSGRAEGEDSDVEEERVDIPSKDTNADTKVGLPSEELPSGSKDADKKTWTSLQYAEGIAILNKFMKESKKKCANCKRANPALSSPTFGWLNMTLRGSSISANTILESDLGMLSANEDRPADPASDDDSQDDEELSSPANAPFQSRNFTPDNFKGKLSSAGQDHLLPSEAESILKDLWKNEPELCRLICNMQQNNLSVSGSDTAHAMFFLKDIIVPPCKFRPPALGGHGAIEHPQNILLAKVQESNIALGKLLVARPDDDITRWRMDLQRSVNVLYDSSKGIAKSERDNNGIRQLLEKKAGILRQKMMGKRVNFACRSVISPDPCLAVNEIGIPPDFALKLTYPERVTPWNVNNMRHAIMNGATIHPGASHYVEKDTTYKLHVPRHKRSQYSRRLPTSRVVTGQSGKGPLYDFEGKIVYRHLQDGDIVLVNRQPTLHKPSMMAHVVRVLKGEKTLRMHYANCSTYNADFDGDEMNVHFPQDEISRAEAINIVNANKQYIVPTSGEPIRGLIQDHIASAVLLSMKGLFLTREEYHQLLYASCVPPTLSSQSGNLGRKVCTVVSDNEIKPLPPAIWKPKPLWTGKQVIAAILCHITRGRSPFTVEKEGRIPKEYFATDSKESMMHINNNDFIHGMIDKAQFGKYGLVHIVHELYGADIAGTLLSIFSRLFTTFLHMNGFTCGVDDLLLLRESDIDRENMLKTCEERSVQVHLSYTHMEKDAELSDLHREIEKIIRSHGEAATVRLDRMMSNALNMLTSDVNKKLFPSGLQKPFPKNCLSLMTTTGAKGGLVNLTQISSLLGQQELEGKRVPRIISGKTLPCFSPWDISCRAGGFISDRFLTGLRPQEYYFHCMAGRDGLVDTAIKTSRSGYLQRCLVKSLESLKVCYDYTVRDADGSIVQFAYGEDGVDVLKSSYITELEVLANNKRVVLESLSSQLEDSRLSKLNGYIKELPYNLKEKAKEFAKQVTSGKGHNRIKKKDVMKLMMLKYMSSLADPGESVGVIAAQSVGEPSTQMTLNTFHLAGRGDMNVTLGIPRLQEILMTAKEEIRTPIMTCPLLTERDPRKLAPALAAKLRRICIADIVESIDVSTLPFFIHKDCVSTLYKLKMKLYPPHLYPESTKLEFKDVIEVLQTSFVEAMEVAITRHLDFISKISDIEVSSGMAETNVDGEIEDVETENKSVNGEDNGGGGGGGGGENDDDDGDSDNGEDQGADGEKRKKQRCDEMEYEDDIEKHSSTAVVNELNEGVQSGFESEVDQAEVEDDYELGQDDPSSLTDKKMPDSKHTTKPPHGPEVSEKKKETKKVGHRKKIKSVIHVEAKGFTFEVHFKLTNQPHILLAEIAQKTAKSIFVQQSKNIDRCSVVELKRSGDVALQTLGVNFFAFWDMQDHLDIDKVVTNDIVAMLNTYGVEAARATIINEVKAVFDPYGIKVNTRHLSLIADFMTAHGGYRPMNRLGMMDFNTSPFSKMTFETATRFIIEAAFHGESDMLESPSASICLGQPVKFGTGVFDLLQKL